MCKSEVNKESNEYGNKQKGDHDIGFNNDKEPIKKRNYNDFNNFVKNYLLIWVLKY